MSWTTVRAVVFIYLIGNTLSQILLPPFRQMAHDVQSGVIEVTNNRTFRITEFYYDGLSRHAQFRAGKGEPSSDSTIIPIGNDNSPLLRYTGQNITITLPGNLSIYNIDYVSLWCSEEKISFGHVYMHETWLNSSGKQMILPKVVSPFRNTSHGVSSGPITLRDGNSIYISNFYYDGNANKTHFWVGFGKPSSNGTIVLSELGGIASLRKYNGKNITITLPAALSLINYDYLAIWDDDRGSFGHVFLNGTYVDHNELKQYIGSQYPGVENNAFGLRSGPIIVVNKNKLYITNFHYNNTQDDLYFFTGRGRTPSSSGTILVNQEGLKEPIRESNGSFFYLTLPDNINKKDDNYFGIWNARSRTAISVVIFSIQNVAETNVNPEITKDGRKIIRYPKCCSQETVMSIDGCTENIDKVLFGNSIPVHQANDTHLNDVPMVQDRVLFVPYVKAPSCNKSYALTLHVDQYILLTSGKLLYLDLQAIKSPDEYCLDVLVDNSIVEHAVFICTDLIDEGEVFGSVIKVCIFISAVSLLFTACVFFIINSDSDDKRGVSIAGFAGFMSLAFFCLFITQFSFESQDVCNFFGFVFQFFIVSSLIWLDALCFEVLYYIKYFNSEEVVSGYRKRVTWYISLALVIPLFLVIISLSLQIPVGLMNVNLDKTCFFEIGEQKWLLYSPILATIIIAIGVTAYSSRLYYRTNAKSDQKRKTVKDDINGADWRLIRPDVKGRLMLCVFLVILTSFCWICEIATYACGYAWHPVDILHALQGLFTMLIVLGTGNIFNKVKKRLCVCSSKDTLGYSGDTHELQRMNGNNNGTA